MRKWMMLWVPILFLMDRAAKIWAYNVLRPMPGGAMELIPGVIRLRYAENTGAAFSLFSGNPWVLAGITSVLMIGILLYILLSKQATPFMRMSLMVVLAGGLGNLYDRFVYGMVIDYLEPLFVHFAIFNLADVFVTVGMVLFVISAFMPDRKEGIECGMDDPGNA